MKNNEQRFYELTGYDCSVHYQKILTKPANDILSIYIYISLCKITTFIHVRVWTDKGSIWLITSIAVNPIPSSIQKKRYKWFTHFSTHWFWGCLSFVVGFYTPLWIFTQRWRLWPCWPWTATQSVGGGPRSEEAGQ